MSEGDVGRLRAIGIAPEFWAEQPDAAVQTIRDEMAKAPAAAWVIVIAPLEDARQFIDSLNADATEPSA